MPTNPNLPLMVQRPNLTGTLAEMMQVRQHEQQRQQELAMRQQQHQQDLELGKEKIDEVREARGARTQAAALEERLTQLFGTALSEGRVPTLEELTPHVGRTRAMQALKEYKEYEDTINPPAKPAADYNLAPGGQRRSGTTNELLAEAPATPEKPPAPPTNLDAAILDAERRGDQAAVERYMGLKERVAKAGRAPQTPSAPSSQWVIRNGQPVHTDTIQPGDSPYRAPQSTTETAQDRQRNARTQAARGFLKKLNELREKINTKMGPAAGLTGLARRGAASIGLDPDVAEYERERAAGGRSLAVAIMGAQNLSDADAKAWADMLPGATVDKDTAKRLMDQVETMLNEMQGDSAPQTVAPASGKKRKVGRFDVEEVP